MRHRHQSLEGFPIVISVPVQWGDMDAYGHVNNTVYLRWFESVRVAYLERVALWEMMSPDGIGPILAAISCNYRRPLKYPDTVHVGARVTRIGKTSFRMEHVVISESEKVIGAEGDSTVVVLDYNHGRPHPVPDKVRKAIEQLEGKIF